MAVPPNDDADPEHEEDKDSDFLFLVLWQMKEKFEKMNQKEALESWIQWQDVEQQTADDSK